jgi:hypothetical protein
MSVLSMLTGTGLGCLAMYVFDPEAGRRRRALARDKLTLAKRKAGEAAAAAGRDLKNRTLGSQHHWSPATRLVVSMASTAALVGIGLLAYGLSEKSAPSLLPWRNGADNGMTSRVRGWLELANPWA